MTYKFKVEVYRFNPYRGVQIALMGIIGIPAAIFLLQKIDRFSPGGIADAQAQTLAPAVIPPSALALPPSTIASQTPAIFSEPAPVAFVSSPAVPEPTPAPGPEPEASPKKGMLPARVVPLYHFRFEGRVLEEGEPVANATVTVRLITRHGTHVKEATTQADGSYEVKVPFKALDNDTMEWSVEAVAPNAQRAEQTGRRIFMEDDALSLDQTLDLSHS